jgi:hypothetical protein
MFSRAMIEDKPLADKANAKARELVGQAQQAQSNAHLHRLMQLGKQKHRY